MAEKEKNDEKDIAQNKSTKKSLILWVLLGCIVVIGLGGFLGWTLYTSSGNKQNNQNTNLSETSDRAQVLQESILFPMEEFIVNLTDGSGFGKRYLKTSIELEVSSEEGINSIEAHVTQLKDAILMLLSSRSVEEVITVEGKLELKQALLVRVNQTLSDNVVRELYFTEFVIQ
jgi:flagellar FliL protein